MLGRWGARDAAALTALLAVFAAFVARSWLGWGYLDYDYGREMLLPERLAAGDVIYRDVRYFYGPLSPYLHALGYRLFGPSLAVLYASGLISTALLVLALYAVGRALGSVAASLLAALLACVDLMFIPGHISAFSFVFPYAFPALHGLLLVTVALAAALVGLRGTGVAPCVVAGVASGLALATKQDWGAVALLLVGATALALLLRDGFGAWRRVALLGLACVVPPLLVYGALATRMPARDIFARGLFDPAYFGWRISWLIMGFQPGDDAGAMLATLAAQHARAVLAWGATVGIVAAFALGSRPASGAGRVVARAIAAAGPLGVVWVLAAGLAPGAGGMLREPAALAGRYAALPLLLAAWLVVEAGLAARALVRGERPAPSCLARQVALVVALAPLARVPASLDPRAYANFALPLAIVVTVVLLVDLLPRGLARLGGSEAAARGAAVAMVALAIAALGLARFDVWRLRTDALVTPRGTMRFFALDPTVAVYRAALGHLIAHTAPGERVLAIPAEASLVFLSGRGNRVYESGLVGVVADEASDRAFADELARDPPEVILISNRPQPEYGRERLGIDYGRAIHRFVAQRYEVETGFGDAFRIVVHRLRGTGERARSSLPPGVAAERDLVYAEVDGVPLRLDVYRPDGAAGSLPVLLFLHGGGWTLGDKRDVLPNDGQPAHAFQKGRRWPSMLPYLERGLAVVSAQYRLADQAPAPAALEDAQRALAWIARDGARHGLDGERVAAIGASAGGHLALLLGLAPLPVGTPRPRGVIDLYGPTDVADLLPPSPNARPFARRWIPAGRGERALARRMSPLAHVAPDVPPVLIVHGDADDVVPYDHAVRLATALREAGARVELVTLPGGRHGFLTDPELAQLEQHVVAFLRSIGLLPGGAPGAASALTAAPGGP